MNRILKGSLVAVTLALVGAIGVLVVLGYLFASSGGLAACGEDVSQEAVSPDGQFVAIAFVRNCGATTGYVTHVNVRRSADKFAIETAGVINEGQIFLEEGKQTVAVSWKGRIVAIRYGDLQVFKEIPRGLQN